MKSVARGIALGPLVGVLALAACCGKNSDSLPDAPLPAYSEVRAVYNERTDKLGVIWARAVVSLDWTEDDGDRRYEQGDGYLQVRQPDRVALSIGKFGETFYWIGSAAERYWFIDRRNDMAAYVGSHDAIGGLESTPLPTGPRELLVLSGVTPLPATDDVQMYWAGDGDLVIEPVVEGGASYRYVLDPRAYLPEQITLLDGGGRAVIVADLSRYERLDVHDLGDDPQMAGVVNIKHQATDGEIQLNFEWLADQNNFGVAPPPEVFDFDVLVDRLGPLDVVDVDASLREEPAS